MRYPDIALEIITDDSDADIVNEGIDAGIRPGEWIQKDMVAVGILRRISAGHRCLPGISRKAPNDLDASETCIRTIASSGAGPRMSNSSMGNRIEWTTHTSGGRRLVVVNDTCLVLKAAINGVGIANLPEPLAVAAISEGKLVPLLEDWAPRMSGLFLYYSSRRQVPAPLKAFIEFMRRHRNSTLSPTAVAAAPLIQEVERKIIVRSGKAGRPGLPEYQNISPQLRSDKTRPVRDPTAGRAN